MAKSHPAGDFDTSAVFNSDYFRGLNAFEKAIVSTRALAGAPLP